MVSDRFREFVDRIRPGARTCPVCGEPADHFGPTVEVAADGPPALVHRDGQRAYIHLLDAAE